MVEKMKSEVWDVLDYVIKRPSKLCPDTAVTDSEFRA